MKITHSEALAIGQLFPAKARSGSWPAFTRSGRTYRYNAGPRNEGYIVSFDSPKGIGIVLDFSFFTRGKFRLQVSVPSEKVSYATEGDTADIKIPELRLLVETAMKDVAAEVAARVRQRSIEQALAEEAKARDLGPRL